MIILQLEPEIICGKVHHHILVASVKYYYQHHVLAMKAHNIQMKIYKRHKHCNCYFIHTYSVN